MPNRCSIEGCTSGYTTKTADSPEAVASFHYPLKNPSLLEKWTSFTNRRDWHPSVTSVICEKHFHEDAMTRGKRVTLKWNLNPVPTKFIPPSNKRPLCLPAIEGWRKPPKVRNIEPDQLPDFNDADLIRSITDLDAVKHCPPGYKGMESDSGKVFFKTEQDGTGFPSISAAIRVDKDLHVKLQYHGNPVPLPKWFTIGQHAKLTRLSMLENFPAYLTNQAESHPPSILEELKKRQFYDRAQGQLPYSTELIRYSLLLRYTSPQCYRLLQEKLPFPSFSLLSKLHKGGISSLAAAKILLEAGSVSSDVILMADEMYLQQSTQYHGGKFYGEDTDGSLFKGIVVLMIVGLKQSVPIVVQAVPETSVTGESDFFHL